MGSSDELDVDPAAAAAYDDALGSGRSLTGFEKQHAQFARTVRLLRDAIGLHSDELDSADNLEITYDAGAAPPLPERFQSLSVLGEGTFGVVLLCRDILLQRDVAIKIPHEPFRRSAAMRQRFARESQAVARLNHPNIVRVLEAGEFDGVPFLVSEHVRGDSLAQVLRAHGPLPARRAARMIADLADAVHQAHERGVLHRDIKPENILIDPVTPNDASEGIPRLTDFGLARLIDEQLRLSTSGMIVGTPHYMAPEQLQGHLSQHCPATDVFSLGAVLYELLTGTGPFASCQTIPGRMAAIDHRVTFPGSSFPGSHNIPRDLSTICLKCLEPDKGDRYIAAADLRDDLKRFLDGLPTLARPLPVLEQVTRWTLRNRPLASAIGLLILASILIATVSVSAWVMVSRRNEALRQALTQSLSFSQQARRQQLLAERNEQNFRQAALRSALQQSFRECEHQRFFQSHRLMHYAASFHRRNEPGDELALLQDVLSRQFQLCYTSPQPLFEHTFLPGGEIAVAVGTDGDTILLDVTGKRPLRALRAGVVDLHSVAVTTDGSRLAVSGAVDPRTDLASIHLMDAESGTVLAQHTVSVTTVESLAFSEDGRYLACGSRYENVRVFDLTDDTVIEIPAELRHHSLAIINAPTRVILGRDREHLSAFDVVNGRQSADFEVPEGIVAFAISPDRQLAAVALLREHAILILDIESGHRLAVLHDLREFQQCVNWSPDGKRIACGAMDGTVSVWQLSDAVLRPETNQFDAERQIVSVPVSASAQMQSSRVMSLAWNGNEALTALGEDGTLTNWVISPDGDRLQFHTGDGEGIRCIFMAGTRVLGGDAKGHVKPVSSTAPGKASERDEPIVELHSTEASVTALTATEDGRYVAVADASGTIHVTSLTGELLWKFRSEGIYADGELPVSSMRFSSDAGTLAWTGDDARLHIAHRRKDSAAPQDNPSDPAYYKERTEAIRLNSTGWTVDVSPDGQLVACGGSFEQVFLVEAETGRVSMRLPGGTHCHVCRFSENGTILFTGHADGTLRAWSISDGRRVFSHRIQDSQLWDFAMLNNGRTVISIGQDGRVLLNDLHSGELIGQLLAAAETNFNRLMRPGVLSVPHANLVFTLRPLADGSMQLLRWSTQPTLQYSQRPQWNTDVLVAR